MAERRMFAKTIIDSDAFLEMPISARLLYYDLSMRADDDGFVNSPKKIMKFVGATNDDMNILSARKFVIAFDNGVVVIKHWRIHNYIRKDTYNETPYLEQKAMLELDEKNAYRLVSQRAVNEPSTQVRLGKDSIGKNKEDIYEALQTFKSNLTPTDYEMINEVIDKYSLEQFKEAIEISKSNNAKTIKYLLQVLKNPIRNKRVMLRPKWMDEDLTRKDVKLTDEEQRELDEIIKGS